VLKRFFISSFLSICVYAAPLAHIVLLGDPHIPGTFFDQKEAVIDDINQWDDATMVIALGDLCQKTGSKSDYDAVQAFFSRLQKPLHVINGNHDYMYADALDEQGHHHKAPLNIQMEKLHYFQTLFHLPKPYYSLVKEPYLLLFLSADNPKYLTALSKEQLSWMSETLKQHPTMPTIVFFHGPLEHTLRDYTKNANMPHFIAQPKEALQDIIASNPQIFLWVSGHMHTTPKEESFASSINWYNAHLLNLHNMDMNHKVIYTNSLFLEKDRVIIKTYNHAKKEWVENLQRNIMLPKF